MANDTHFVDILQKIKENDTFKKYLADSSQSSLEIVGLQMKKTGGAPVILVSFGLPDSKGVIVAAFNTENDQLSFLESLFGEKNAPPGFATKVLGPAFNMDPNCVDECMSNCPDPSNPLVWSAWLAGCHAGCTT